MRVKYTSRFKPTLMGMCKFLVLSFHREFRYEGAIPYLLGVVGIILSTETLLREKEGIHSILRKFQRVATGLIASSEIESSWGQFHQK